jgi:hypothetical protein
MTGRSTLPLFWRFRATASALLIPPLLHTVSFNRLAGWLSHKKRYSSMDSVAFNDAAMADWVDRVLRRLRGPWRHTCLKRGTILFFLLRKAGRPIELWIGVDRDEAGGVTAHAWLVHQGEPYLETDPSHPGQFKVIARFPEAG